MAPMGTLVFVVVLVAALSDLQPAESRDILRKVGTYFKLPWDKKDKHGDEVIYRLFTRDRPINEPEVFHSDTEIDFKRFSLQRPTTVMIHGWKGYSNCTFTFTVLSAYLSAKDHNVITVDWSGAGSRTHYYPDARNKVPVVASHVATFLDSLHKQKGVKLEDIHVVGHSLGAHIAGIAGYLVQNGKIGRITGSDPAGPLFSENDRLGRLSEDSAQFVDVIHTSASFMGFGGTLGHADFFPNGPHMLQPGCGIDVTGRCSHRRGYNFFAESIMNPRAFLAVPCPDWEHFQRRECDVSAVVPMGESTPSTARGIYYLATNKHSPFGTGVIWQ